MSAPTRFPGLPGIGAGLAVLCSAGLAMATPLHAQDRFVGTWSGDLDVGVAQLRLVLHVELDEPGYTAALDRPDQGAFGIEASAVAIDAWTAAPEREGDRLDVDWALFTLR